MNSSENSQNDRYGPKDEWDGEYIVTPGLRSLVEDFERRYKIFPLDVPIMLVGPTGVGKSVFLHIYKTLYRKDYKTEKLNPIEEANCAHFGGPTSDPNVARSELFGSVEGAYTGAVNRIGLVEKAKNGLLILEEIGELPLEVQAMLLTFIEKGEYRKVGDSKTDHSKLRIVGATNREEVLRSDFRNRFIPFYIPAIYERRGDILYYLSEKFPDLIETLRTWEVMALMAYNWPGNVREIERIGWLFKITQEEKRENLQLVETRLVDLVQKLELTENEINKLRQIFQVLHESGGSKAIPVFILESLKKLGPDEFGIKKIEELIKKKVHELEYLKFQKQYYSSIYELSRLLFPNKKEIKIDVGMMRKLYRNLREAGIKVKVIDAMLGLFRVGINCEKDEFSFKDFSNRPYQTQYDRGLKILLIQDSSIPEKRSPLVDAYEGFRLFCSIFFQNYLADKNITDIGDDFSYDDNVFLREKDFPNYQEYEGIIKSIFTYLSGIKVSTEESIPWSGPERVAFFKKLAREYPKNEFLIKLGWSESKFKSDPSKEPNIWLMEKNKLERFYYEGLLKLTGGNKKKAAQMAGEKLSTFNDNLKKVGIVSKE